MPKNKKVIKERELLFSTPQKGDNCPHCHGTYFWVYADSKECVKCKNNLPIDPLINN
ncbi:MAG: hypothetical protein GF365_05025 [Candidatus Buchananbacteria bacterium]|nr:hypothetical protein [Candidatus Buchananbacteria bacterium]